jgi:hypothetical protein
MGIMLDMLRVLRSLLFALAFAVLGFGQTPARQLDANLSGLSRSFERIVEHVRPSVVQVIARRLKEEGDSG